MKKFSFEKTGAFSPFFKNVQPIEKQKLSSRIDGLRELDATMPKGFDRRKQRMGYPNRIEVLRAIAKSLGSFQLGKLSEEHMSAFRIAWFVLYPAPPSFFGNRSKNKDFTDKFSDSFNSFLKAYKKYLSTWDSPSSKEAEAWLPSTFFVAQVELTDVMVSVRVIFERAKNEKNAIYGTGLSENLRILRKVLNKKIDVWRFCEAIEQDCRTYGLSTNPDALKKIRNCLYHPGSRAVPRLSEK